MAVAQVPDAEWQPLNRSDVAKRQQLEEQACLPRMEPAKQLEFSFPTVEMHENRYKVLLKKESGLSHELEPLNKVPTTIFLRIYPERI